jgi:hypothetical protein
VRRAHPLRAQMTRLCEAVAALHDAGHRVVLVSSGAVGAGCQRLGAPGGRRALILARRSPAPRRRADDQADGPGAEAGAGSRGPGVPDALL